MVKIYLNNEMEFNVKKDKFGEEFILAMWCNENFLCEHRLTVGSMQFNVSKYLLF